MDAKNGLIAELETTRERFAMLRRQLIDCYGEGHPVAFQSARVAAALKVLCAVIDEAEREKSQRSETVQSMEYDAALKEFKDATRAFRDASAEKHDLPSADGYYQVEQAFKRQERAYSRLGTARRRFSESSLSPSPTSGPGSENKPKNCSE